MSKRKAKQAPPLFREFKQWPLEQAMAAAQMLYASHEQIRNFVGLVTGDADGKSIKLPWDEPFRWNFLARLAFEFLDHLSHACETVARENAADARTRALQQRSQRRHKAHTEGPASDPFRERSPPPQLMAPLSEKLCRRNRRGCSCSKSTAEFLVLVE